MLVFFFLELAVLKGRKKGLAFFFSRIWFPSLESMVIKYGREMKGFISTQMRAKVRRNPVAVGPSTYKGTPR